jgi:hypothetical protein
MLSYGWCRKPIRKTCQFAGHRLQSVHRQAGEAGSETEFLRSDGRSTRLAVQPRPATTRNVGIPAQNRRVTVTPRRVLSRSSEPTVSPLLRRALLTLIPHLRSDEAPTYSTLAQIVLRAAHAHCVATLCRRPVGGPNPRNCLRHTDRPAHCPTNRGPRRDSRPRCLSTTPRGEHCFPVVGSGLPVHDQWLVAGDGVHFRAEDVEVQTAAAERVGVGLRTGADYVQVGHRQVPFATSRLAPTWPGARGSHQSGQVSDCQNH